jgi:hypothetical protein
MWHAWERNVYKVLMGKPEGKRPLGRPRHRWEDAIRMDLRDGGSRVDPVSSGQEPVAGSWKYDNEPFRFSCHSVS